MARKRYIKPEFFDDLDLAEVSIEARFLFAGMWCFMDRQAVIEYDSRIHRKNVFPHDEKVTPQKVKGWLDELIEHGFVVRFAWQGKDLIYCPTLKKHQRLYPDEKARFDVTQEFLDSFDTPPPHGTLRETQGTCASDVEVEVEEKGIVLKPELEKTEDGFGPRELAAAWNERMASVKDLAGKAIPLVDLKRLNSKQDRWIAAKARLAEEPSREVWVDAIDRIARSEFCRGRGSRNGWAANFDFLTRPKTIVGVLEGLYGCTAKKNPAAAIVAPIRPIPEEPSTLAPEKLRELMQAANLVRKVPQ